MSNLTIRDVIGAETTSSAVLNLDHLVALEYALDCLDIPWIKGIRLTYRCEGDGIYFNKEVGENVVAVLSDGITMPTLINTKYGIELDYENQTHYSYEEFFVRLIDVSGPRFTQKGISKLKELANLASPE